MSRLSPMKFCRPKTLNVYYAYNLNGGVVSETISTRVPEGIRREVEEFMREENLDKSAAIRKLLKTGLTEWRKRRALKRLEEGEVTFNQAAEIAGMDVWNFADLVRKKGGIWINSVDRIRSDIEAAEE